MSGGKCIICGASVVTAAATRDWPEKGAVEACSKTCAAHPKFTGGLAVVPREPTEAMIRAALDRDTKGEASIYSGVWRAMVAAVEGAHD